MSMLRGLGSAVAWAMGVVFIVGLLIGMLSVFGFQTLQSFLGSHLAFQSPIIVR